MKLRLNLPALVAGICAGCALLSTANAAHAWSHSNTGQWFSTQSGSYILDTDEWGSSAPVTMYYNSPTNWDLYCNFSGGGVKAYPHTQVNTNVSESSYNIWAYFNASPGSGTFDLAFDNWDSNGAEYMIWENWGGGAGPIGGEVASNVYISGAGTFNVYSGNDGHECISFLQTSKTNSGTQSGISSIMGWAYSHGYTHSTYVDNIQFGYEVSSTSGNQNWTLNSFSAGW
jgi:hypothetical protein